MVISIGYSSCHWCHVMEEESFADPEVAEVMNKHFISVKVDREERPDVDQVYINAVQLMTGGAGWPLNVVTLPDGRPIWGGTYFRKEDWINALNQLHDIYEKDPEKVFSYAEKLENGIKSLDFIELNKEEFSFKDFPLEAIIRKISQKFDEQTGGFKGAPKFIMPNTLEFLLRYSVQKHQYSILDFVKTSLQKIAFGGIFDRVEGGFSRYSVDSHWHIPHFEKMLYDNALIVSLYSKAYAATGENLFREVAEKTLDFISKNLTSPDGAFYSALDADSFDEEEIRKEGAYYTFSEEELKNTIENRFDIFQSYYAILPEMEWEGKYVLFQRFPDEEIKKTFNVEEEDFVRLKKEWKERLKKLRDQRSKPRLDDKSVTAWNAMMQEAYIDAYNAFGKESYLNIAEKNANLIIKSILQEDGSIFRIYKSGKSSIHGFLEDYAFVIQSFISLYQTTSDWKWLDHSKHLMEYCLKNFFDKEKQLFYFTSVRQPKVLVRSFDFYDNEIPSSNSIMAKNLFLLSKFYGQREWEEISGQMFKNIAEHITTSPLAFTNWLDLLMNFHEDFFEVVIVGEKSSEFMKNILSEYIPNKILASSPEESSEFLFQNRFNQEKTSVFVCVNNSCHAPLYDIQETIQHIKKY